MKFHLGSEQFKIHLNGKTYKVKYVGTGKPKEINYTLTVYWRPGVAEVEIIRESSLNQEATLGRLYSGDKIYAGDVLTVTAYEVEGYSILDYEHNITVAGDTLIYIEPNGWTYDYTTQEIVLPSGDTVAVYKNSEHRYEISADFDLQTLNNGKHWGYCSIAEELLSAEQYIDLYDFDTYSDNGYQEAMCLEPEDEAAYIRQHGDYLGSIWIGPGHSWYITRRSELIND